MNDIEFRVVREVHDPIGEHTVLDVDVDGTRLVDLVAAGRPPQFMGIDPSDEFAVSRLRGGGVLSTSRGRTPRTMLLRCTCGDEGCARVSADVLVGERTVTWSSLEIDGDRAAAADLGPFTFDRAEYVGSLERALDRPWPG